MNYCDQSDPTRNRQFGKFWGSRDPFFRRTPSDLDRRADVELQHGHVARAEYLAQLALALRDAGR